MAAAGFAGEFEDVGMALSGCQRMEENVGQNYRLVLALMNTDRAFVRRSYSEMG